MSKDTRKERTRTLVSGALVTSRNRRRSSSHDSHLQRSASACGTLGRPRSPSPTSHRRGLLDDLPERLNSRREGGRANDKLAQIEKAKFILEFLDAQGCPSKDKPERWQALVYPPSISGSKFIAIMKFIASCVVLVPESFFTNKSPDEVVEKIIVVSKILKYPGSITKSDLRWATIASTVWPTCLAFMYWLCCRKTSSVNPTPPQGRKGIDKQATNGIKEAAGPAQVTPNEEPKEPDEIVSESEQLQNSVDPPEEGNQVQIPPEEIVQEEGTGIKRDNYSNISQLIQHLKQHEKGIDARRAEIAKIRTQFESQAGSEGTVPQVGGSTDQMSKDLQECPQQLESLQKQVEDLQAKLQSSENYIKFLSAELQHFLTDSCEQSYLQISDDNDDGNIA